MKSNPGAGSNKIKANHLRIVVVDDQVFIRELISATLNHQSTRYKVLATVGTTEAIGACEEFAPDLVILDIDQVDQRAIDVVAAIKRVTSETHVLLCTAFPTEGRIVYALRVGAKGFVEKTSTWEDFLVAVDRVGRGEQYFSAKNTRSAAPLNNGIRTTPPNGTSRTLLSRREQQVITLIAQGSTSKEIARKLFISTATVETHRTNLMSKLGVRNVASLVLYAFQNGLVETSSSGQSRL